MFLKSLEQSLKTTNQKEKRYDLSLVFVDRLTMMATALNQGGSTRWFNLAATICVKSGKPIGFIFPTMRDLFCDTHRVHQACFSYGYTEPNKTAHPVVYLKPIGHDESVQISIQLHWDRPHALNLTAAPPL